MGWYERSEMGNGITCEITKWDYAMRNILHFMSKQCCCKLLNTHPHSHPHVCLQYLTPELTQLTPNTVGYQWKRNAGNQDNR